MRLILISLSLLFSLITFSQAPSFEWAKKFNGSNFEFGSAIDFDSTGNTYTSGKFRGTVDFDPGPGVFSLTSSSSGNQTNAFITKLDASGNFVWAKSFLCSNSSAINSIHVDDFGNIFVSGNFNGTCDFDPSPTVTFNISSTGGLNAYVCKLSSQGDFIWAKNTGTNNANSIEIDIDNQGNVITVGNFSGSVDFDPSPAVFNITSTGSNADIFVSKLDANGNFVWAKQIGASGIDIGHGVATDDSGNIYLTGYFRNTVDFDPNAGTFNLTSAGDADIFICKLDTSGNFNWAHRMGGADADGAYSIAGSDNGKVYISGEFQNTIDFDPGTGVSNKTSNGFADIFVVQFDTAGAFGWVQTIGGSSNDFSVALVLDDNENVYLNGMFRNTVDFDPGAGTFNLTSINTSDFYICKLSNTGTFDWAVSMGLQISGYDGPGIVIDDSYNVYATGFFNTTSDFDPSAGVFNMTPTSSSIDCFTLKLGQCVPNTPTIAISSSPGDTICAGATVTFTATSTNGGSSPIYQWKKNGVNVGANAITYSSSSLLSGDVITCELTSNDPCATSSSATSNSITMIVNQPTSGTDVQTVCDSYTWIDGNTYTNSNSSATYVLTNSQGCDSTVTLNLTITNSSSGTDTQTACDSYIWIDGNTYTNSNSSATHILTNSQGGDSTVTPNLTITNSSTGTDTQTACDSYTWIDGNTY
ncbi:MAG: SBBP repeat-containing protein, partial [Crocinitomicaceae bacterium]